MHRKGGRLHSFFHCCCRSVVAFFFCLAPPLLALDCIAASVRACEQRWARARTLLTRSLKLLRAPNNRERERERERERKGDPWPWHTNFNHVDLKQKCCGKRVECQIGEALIIGNADRCEVWIKAGRRRNYQTLLTQRYKSGTKAFMTSSFIAWTPTINMYCSEKNMNKRGVDAQ